MPYDIPDYPPPELLESVRAQLRVELDRIIDDFIDDYLTVAEHVIGDTDSYLHEPTIRAVMDSCRRREFAPLPVLENLVTWTLTMLRWRARQRPLTSDEHEVQAAALRLAEIINGSPSQ
jgi:hypothetical protein